MVPVRTVPVQDDCDLATREVVPSRWAKARNSRARVWPRALSTHQRSPWRISWMASPGRAEAMAASEGLMAIIGAGHGAHFCAATFGTEGFHLPGNVVGQSELQVDPRQWRGQPPQGLRAGNHL